MNMGEIDALIQKAKRKIEKINEKLKKEIECPIKQTIETYNREQHKYLIKDHEVVIENSGEVKIMIKKIDDKESNKPIKKGSYNWIQAMNIQSDIKRYIQERFNDELNIEISKYYIRKGKAI